MRFINIYTDGACSGNQNKKNAGGWGCILECEDRRKELFGGELNTTNNRMELSALIAGLSAIKESGCSIKIFSDSSYLVNCFKDRWYEKWLKNGWKTSAGKPVENKELWEKLIDLCGRHEIAFFLIKGHLDKLNKDEKKEEEYRRFVKNNGSSFSRDEFMKIAAMNQRADELANNFIKAQKGSHEEEGASEIKKPALIFDVDGTLWDASEEVERAWDDTLQKRFPQYGIALEKGISKKVMGLTMDKIKETLFSKIPKEKRDAAFSHITEDQVVHLRSHPGRLFPKVKETLSILSRKYDLYIASNCQLGYIEALIFGCKLDGLFKGHISFGETGKDKGENLKILIKREKIERAVMVGDTAMDEKAADFAEIPFIHAAYGFGKASNPAALVKSFDEIPMAAEKIFAKGI